MSKFARLISRIIMCIPDEIQGNICVAKIRSAARKEATKLAKEARLAMKQEELATKEAIADARRNSDLEYKKAIAIEAKLEEQKNAEERKARLVARKAAAKEAIEKKCNAIKDAINAKVEQAKAEAEKLKDTAVARRCCAIEYKKALSVETEFEKQKRAEAERAKAVARAMAKKAAIEAREYEALQISLEKESNARLKSAKKEFAEYERLAEKNAAKKARREVRRELRAESKLLVVLMYAINVIACIVLAVLTTNFALSLQSSPIKDFDGLWTINFIPILLTAIGLSWILQNAFFGNAINGLVWSLLSCANTIKIAVRDEPVLPSDLLLLKEAASAMGEYRIKYPVYDLELLCGAILVLILLGVVFQIIFKDRIKSLRQTRGIVKLVLIRVLGAAIAFGICFGIVNGVYTSRDMYESYDIEDYAHLSSPYNDLGFPYSFCHYVGAYKAQKPNGYDEEEASLYGSNIQTESTDPNIHIVMILSEAYSDLTDLDKIRYVDKEDPLKTFKAMAAGENSISGHIIVPGFAGGTANTEFNVLTGMQTEMLSDSNATAFRMFSTKQESVLSVLKEEGYKTDFIHPGLDWYYDRKNVYKRLGADNMLFAKDMDDMWTHGDWVADDYVAALIERHFEEAVANGEWLCSMSVTIQNHMSYTRQKYWNQDFDDMDIMATLSNDVYDALGIYSVGVRDANKMLDRLKKYFEKTDEPVMLVFFGDHMPYLGDDRKGYKELGIDYVYSDDQDKQLMMYETPYIIWCNEAGAKAIDFDNKVKSLKLPEDGIIQSSYLGGLVLELSGHSQSSPWFSYLCEARKSLPVTRFASGTNDMLDKLAKWTYYKIKH